MSFTHSFLIRVILYFLRVEDFMREYKFVTRYCSKRGVFKSFFLNFEFLKRFTRRRIFAN